MVKNLKRTLALMLSIIMIFSSTLTAFADDEGMAASSEVETSAQIEETVAAEETSTEAPKVEAPTKEQPVEAATEAEKEEATVIEETEEVYNSAPAPYSVELDDVAVYEGEDAVFEIRTDGDVRSCQWQMSKNNGRKWSNLSKKQYGSSDALTMNATTKYDGRLFRCEVTFTDGRKAVSDDALLTVNEEPDFPAVTYDPVKIDDVIVNVDAPAGALPENTKMDVKKVEVGAVQDIVDVTKDVDGTVVTAVDITFSDANGNVIEPKIPIKVEITSDEIAKLDSLTVIHVDAKAEELETADVEAEEVKETEVVDDTVKFDAGKFSVYAILDDGTTVIPDQKYRATYQFYYYDEENNLTEYYFHDAAGRSVYEQILKDGEILEDVGVPAIANQNAKFIGWYDVDNPNTKVNVEEAKTVTENKTIKLYAKFQGLVNVFFYTPVMLDANNMPMERSVVTIKQVQYTTGQSGAITVDTSDVTTDAPTAEQAVVGWSRTQDATEPEGTNGVITLYADGSVNPITDVDLFPVVQDAYWLYFNENDGGTGGGASYTPPQFVTIGGKPTKPDDPHRTGYTFGGWYKDAACTEGQEFDFNAVMTTTTTVYAKWTAAATTYTVIVWVQRTADSARITSANNLSNDQKTYDFYTTYTIDSSTGASATANADSLNLASDLDADGHIKLNRNDGPKEVAANGSTVINVYYDRDVMTIHFKVGQYDSTDTYATWYGLYDATFTESGKTWPVINNRRWTSSSYGYTFMDAFVDFDTRQATSLTLWQQNQTDTTYHFNFQKETLTSGQYTTANSSPRSSGSLKLSEKYKGFSLYRYRNGNSGSWTLTNGSYPSVQYANSDLYIQYSRNSYDLVFQNSVKGTPKEVIKTDHVKYEAPLAGYTTPGTPTYPIAADADHYDFIGWFADSNWTTMVSFTELTEAQMNNYREYYGVSTFIFYTKDSDTMPAHNMVLYAGYGLKGWDCAINPNGGTLTNESQAGVFWLDYGQTFSSDLKTNITREGYVFQGWMVADVPLKSDGTLDLLNVTVDGNNHRFVGDYSNWTITDNPWEFTTGISGPTALMAKWFYLETMKVVYDANGGTNAPVDGGDYSDHAMTVAFRSPVPPANGNFLGWDIVVTENVEERLQPGDTFEVSSDYAVDGKVTLKAVYSSPGSEEEVPISHIDWYANDTTTAEYVIGKDEQGQDIKEEQLTHVSDTDLQLNVGINIRPYNTFTNDNYVFLGWAKLHKAEEGDAMLDHKGNTVAAAASGEHMNYNLTADNLYLKYENEKFYVQDGETWKETSQVAPDENLPYDDMYAVWRKACFYIYHSSDQSVESIPMKSVNGTFDITAKVKNNCYYGGYYKNYRKKGSYAGGPDATLDGISYGAKNQPTVGFWSKADAITSAPGTAMVPVSEYTYYLKEVPEDYLKPYMHIVYDVNSKEIKQLYLITGIDDVNYSEVGLIATDDLTLNETKKQTGAFRVLELDGTETKLTTTGLFGVPGYLAVWDQKATLGVNKHFSYRAYFKTPDGVTVKGKKTRTVYTQDKNYYGTFDPDPDNPGIYRIDADVE